jgi:predicted nucleotidyltransferase
MPRTLTFSDLLIETAREQEKYFKDYLKYAKKIKKAVLCLDSAARVYIFGSILKKREVPEDIDILIVSEKFETSAEKSEAIVKIIKATGFSSPFEFHLATPEEYREWYRYFIKKKVEI